MHYMRFTIKNYRGVRGPMAIDVKRNRLIPVIGVNECGKTTILNALFAFDHYNDESGSHLEDTTNLFDNSAPDAIVDAEIDVTREEYLAAIEALRDEKHWSNEQGEEQLDEYSRKKGLAEPLIISRNLTTRRYHLPTERFPNQDLNHDLCKQLLSSLPYILYFDDFRHDVDRKIRIPQNPSDAGLWVTIVDTLFRKTDSDYSVFALADREERARRSIISDVQRALNRTLTMEWRDFHLDDTDALTVSLVYESDDEGPYLQFLVVETDANDKDHFFYLQNRSKGFYWFFNFVMRLEFNPKVVDSEGVDAIYLLDEPGSYLHASAQERLCKKLRQLADSNCVIYTTHSHHLLNPDTIPVSSIHIAEQDRSGVVSLVRLHDHTGTITEKRWAFQPLLDALQLRPLHFERTEKDTTLIVEGIVDYYLFDGLANYHWLHVLPSVGASSIAYYVSLLLAWRLEFVALWDNDNEGRRHYEKARAHFGTIIDERFHLLPNGDGQKDVILQNLVSGDDLVRLRLALGLEKHVSFDKTIAAWYFHEERDNLVTTCLERTQDEVLRVLTAIGIRPRESK